MTEHVFDTESEIETPPDRLDEYTSYEDDGSLVVCDRSDPNAWVRSDVTAECER